MIDTSLRNHNLSLTTPSWASGPKPQDNVQLGSRELVPDWMRKRTAQVPEQAPPVPVEVHAAEETSRGNRLRMGVMLGLTALGAVAPMLMPTVAHAAVVNSVTSVQQVVDQFSAGQHVYVVGNPAINGVPVANGELGRVQQIMREHPNAYIVLVDGSTNVSADDHALSRGIGNHPDFQKVVNPRTGERQGVVIMVYTGIKDAGFVQNNGGKDRAIFFRSEELPDKLGVGEANFADPNTGAPRELMQTYISAFQAGKGLSGALDAVLDRVDTAVNAYAEGAFNGASSAVQQAVDGLNSTRGQVTEFQRKYGTGGSLGSPDVEGWQRQLEQARQALANKDLQGAREHAAALNASLAQWTSAASAYGEAGQTAIAVRTLLNESGSAIRGLEQNDQAASAATHQAAAEKKLQEFEVAYRAKDPSYPEKLAAAQSEANLAARDVQASRDATQLARNVKLYGGSAVVIGVLVTAFVLNHRARAKSKEAQEALDEATARLGERSKELLDLLNRADYHKVSNYSGKTRQLADQMLDNANEALMLVGGASKFVAEAGDLVEGKGVTGKLKNTFLTGNFDRAIGLLTNPEQKLPFSAGDTARVVMEKDSQAATWREQIMAAGTSKTYEKSLNEVLEQIEQRRALAEGQHQQLETKTEHIVQYMAGLTTRLESATARSAELVKEGGPFSGAEIGKALLPAARADMDAKSNDPVHTYDELQKGSKLGESAGRMVGEAEALLKFAGDTRVKLLPALDQARGAVSGISLDWADATSAGLSGRLDEAAKKATRDSAAEEIKALGDEVAGLMKNLTRVAGLDGDRRGAATTELGAVNGEVKTTREELTAGLQQLGLFKAGGDLMPETNPSTGQARILLDQTGPLLSKGSLDSAAESLDGMRGHLKDARGVMADYKAALAEYPGTLADRQSRHAALTSEVAASFGRLDQGYAAAVQPQAARDVKAGETLSGCVSSCEASLGKASTETSAGVAHADHGELLASRRDFVAADGSLRAAAEQVDFLHAAEKLLASLQQGCEADLGALTTRLSGLTERSASVYVRAAAKELLAQANAQLEKAREFVGAQPQDPYAARVELEKARELQNRTEQTMNADQQIFDQATAMIARSGQEIATANTDVEAAAVKKWSTNVTGFGGVAHAVDASTLATAREQLATARTQHASAESSMPGQKYEEALKDATASSGSATGSSGSSASVVARFKAEYDKMVATAEKQVEMDKALPALEGRVSQTASKAGAEYVRDKAKSLLQQAQDATRTARGMITSSTRKPYEEEAAVQRAESLRTQTESAISSDHQASDTAKSAVSAAGSEIDSSARELSAAESKTFRQNVAGYGDVSLSVNTSELSTARSQLQSAREKLSSAERQVSSKSFEDATRTAGEAKSGASSSSSSTASVLSKTDGEFRKLVGIAERQVEVQRELASVESKFSSTRSRVGESYVRSNTQSAFSSASSELESARSAVNRRPPQPDAARSAVAEAESKRAAVEHSIDADKRAYDSARSKIGSAESSVSSARSAVERARGERWSTNVDGHGSVSESMDDSDLSSARSRLSSAESKLSSARSELSSKDYEDAERRASEADNEADSAASEASSAVSKGKRRFDDLVSTAQAEVRKQREAEERKRREEQEAKERAEREAREKREAEERREAAERHAAEERRRASEGGSGSRGGSSGGSGGSGSTGGAW